MCGHFNEQLHGKHWKRHGVAGVQGVVAIERQKNWNPHAHALLGHPEFDFADRQFSPLLQHMRAWCNEQWGFSDWQVVKAADDCRSYVIDYAAKTGELYLSARLEDMNRGQITLRA